MQIAKLQRCKDGERNNATKRKTRAAGMETKMGLCRRRFCPSLLVPVLICLTHTDGFAPRSRRRVTLLVSQRLDAAAAGAPSDEPGANKSTPFMESVRSIQDVFYSSGRGDESRPFLNKTTGTMDNLPILMSPSTELPGRQTVRFVDNPLDINLLELSLRGFAEKGDKDNNSHCFVGQLYRDPNETGDGPLSRPRIKSWKDFSPDAYDDSESGTCVGTLLRIVDFRRVNDGRMVLLVQGIERFVISKVYQELPYIIVDAQIILDEEELMAYPMPSAVATSFAWHSFEYEDNVKLAEDGSDPGEEVCIGAIVGERLAQLIPFISLKSTNARDLSLLQKSIAQAKSEVLDLVPVGSNDAPIQHLTCRNVLNEVPTFSNIESQGGRLSAGDIEYDLWICIDEYVRLRGLHDVMSSDLMALLPQGKDWPNDFCLEDLAAKLEAKNTQGDGVRPPYPNERRLKRLSYSASALLGGSTPSDLLNKGARQMLLEVPSTRGRLWAVLERFVEYNALLRSKHVDK